MTLLVLSLAAVELSLLVLTTQNYRDRDSNTKPSKCEANRLPHHRGRLSKNRKKIHGVEILNSYFKLLYFEKRNLILKSAKDGGVLSSKDCLRNNLVSLAVLNTNRKLVKIFSFYDFLFFLATLLLSNPVFLH